MTARRLELAIAAARLVAFTTLLRSVVYDRWITVLASVLLIAGAAAAGRGKTWGLGVAFGAAVAFPVAFAIGIAPAWFCLVGIAGALPLVSSWRALTRFDAAATIAGSAIAASIGAIGAVTWKSVAWTVFDAFPSLTPSAHAGNAVLALALAIGAVTASVTNRRRTRIAPEIAGSFERTRIGSEAAIEEDEEREAGESVSRRHRAARSTR
jgi:hypothetical protein